MLRRVEKVLLVLAITVAYASTTPGTWGAWGAFGDTCANCPAGTTYTGRTRVCIPPADGSNGACAGSRIEETVCTCPSTGTWGDWASSGDCTPNCGYCGRRIQNRTCTQVPSCPAVTCVGNDTQTDPTPCSTSTTVCLFPNPSCCNTATETYQKAIDSTTKKFYCKAV